MISCLSDDAKNVNKKLGKLTIRINRMFVKKLSLPGDHFLHRLDATHFIKPRYTRKMNILAEMLTRDPRVLPQEVIDAARKSRKRQPWEI